MTTYSKLNPPMGYYVYAYLREDSTPYYIGKGKSSRAWVTHRRLNDAVLTPRSDNFISIIAHRLSSDEANLLETRLVELYGRKDLGTGILRNMTDGGKGSSGNKPSLEIIEKRKRTRAENKRPNPLKGRKQTPEAIENKRQAMTGKKHTAERNANRSKALTGRKLSAEHIARRSATVTGRKQRPEVIENRAAQLRGRKQEVIICPHCGKSGGCVVMKRHHFDHCKSIR